MSSEHKKVDNSVLKDYTVQEMLIKIYNILFRYWGPQHWWPAESEFEMIVGAILTQNTSWTSVQKAIKNLKEADLLSVEKILNISDDVLSELIRPSGYYNQKAKRLKDFCYFLKSHYDGRIDKLFELPLEKLREVLLSQNGIGFETADSIILYGAKKPVFVVDAYTKRLFYRLGIIENEDIEYNHLQLLIMKNLDNDTSIFNEYHALIVTHCKNICLKKKTKCQMCCLFHICNYKIIN